MLAVLAVFKHRHDFPVLQTASYVTRDSTAVFFNIAQRDSEVFAFRRMVRKLLGEEGHGVFVARNDQQAGRILIDAVHQAWALAFVAIRQMLKEVQQSIDQGVRIVPIARVNHHAGGLIDDDHIAVFVDDIQVQILRKKFNLLGGWASTKVTTSPGFTR